MFRKILIVTASATLLSAMPVEAKKKPEMTSLELQALQSHEYETTKEILFASVVSVFQDLGYQLSNADLSSGFITASSPMKNKTSIWDALGRSMGSGNTKVTAFVEQMPGGRARVRLNFMNSKTTSGMWGGSSAEDKPILDPMTYKVAWDKIDEAVFTRTATTAVSAPTLQAPIESKPAPNAITPASKVPVVSKPAAPTT